MSPQKNEEQEKAIKIEKQDKAMEEFNQKIEEANKYEMKKYSDSIKNLASKYSEPDEIKQLTEFLTNLIALKRAADKPENNPRQFPELQNFNDQQAKTVKAEVAKFIPNVHKILEHAVGSVRIDFIDLRLTHEERSESLALVTNTLRHATELVESKFKDPKKIKTVLDDANLIAQPKILKYCLKNPERTGFVGLVMLMASVALMVLGAIACKTVAGSELV